MTRHNDVRSIAVSDTAEAEGAPAPDPVPVAKPDLADIVRSSRLGGMWALFAGGAVVLVLLLVFILQNSQHVEVHLYGGHWNAPLGVALLMSAALGVLLVVVPGAGRILQLRRAARRAHRRAAELRPPLAP